MALRMRKRIKLLPGLYVNLGKNGTSLSVGTKGVTVNFDKAGTRATVGVPGTGISYSKFYKKSPSSTNLLPRDSINFSLEFGRRSIYVFFAGLIGAVIGGLLAGSTGTLFGLIICSVTMAVAGAKDQKDEKQ